MSHSGFRDPVRVLHDGLEGTKGGVAAGARAIGMSPGVLYNKFSESMPGNQLSLHEALALAARVPGNDFVQAVCAQFSGVFVPVPEPGRAGVADLLVAQAEVMRRYGEVSASFADAWRDGRITQLELDELSTGARRAVSAMLAFVNEVSTLAEEGGSRG